MAAKIPIFKLSEKAPEISPTNVGPPLQPKSPAKASNAKSNVPPRFKEAEAILKAPGQRIPTEKPQIPQPSRLNIGMGESDIKR